MENKQYDDALRHFESAILRNKTSGFFLYNRALVNAKLDKIDLAIKDFKSAIFYLPDTSNEKFLAQFQVGNCLRRTGRLDESISFLTDAVKNRPEDAQAHNNLGLSLFENERFEEAIKEFSIAIIKSANSSVFYNNRGLAYYHDK